MTTTEYQPKTTSAGAHTAGWMTSLVLHGMLAVGAVIFTQQIRLAPEPPPFKWNVAMVTPSPASTPSAAQPAPQPPTSVAPSQKQSVQPISPSRPEPTRVESVQHPMPIAPTKSQPTPQPEQQPAIMKAAPPVQAVSTPPLPAEPIIQERAAIRPPDPPAQQPTQTEPAPALARQEPLRHMETDPTPHEPLTTAPPVQTSAALSEPTVAAAPSLPPSVPHSSSEAASTSAPQVVALAPTLSVQPARQDYGWLSDAILRRVEELKRYPPEARLDRAEGKVVLKAVIRADGSVDDVEVYQSSGYRSLDLAAVELMKQAAPFHLPRPLGKSKITIKVPMSYRLDR